MRCRQSMAAAVWSGCLGRGGVALLSTRSGKSRRCATPPMPGKGRRLKGVPSCVGHDEDTRPHERVLMGQAELRSSGLLAPKSGPLVKGVANSNIKTEANQPLPARNERPDRIEPPLPLTPERLELIKAYARGRARIADEAATSRIAQRFAPRTPDAPPPPEPKPAALPQQTVPLTGINAGIRRLTAALIVAALLPNLTLALFWLGVIDPPWSESASSPPKETARVAATPASPAPEQSALPATGRAAPTFSPVLTAPNVLDAQQGESVSFPLTLDGTDGVPEQSVIVV